MPSRSRSELRSERGQTAVEFALVAPLLIVLLLGVIQVGLAFNHYVTLTDAARAGARKAVVARFSSMSTADIEQAVRDAASDLDQSQLGVSVSSTWQPGSQVSVTATYPYSIDLFGVVVKSGTLATTMKERVE